jgi:hypothetical protein
MGYQPHDTVVSYLIEWVAERSRWSKRHAFELSRFDAARVLNLAAGFGV